MTAPAKIHCPYCLYPPKTPCLFCAGAPARIRPAWFPLAFLRGFLTFYGAALELLTERDYLGRLLLPAGLNAALFVILLAAAVKVLHPLAAQALSFLPAPIALGLGLSLALALTILAAWFLFPVTMILFLQPVLDPLSRRAEARVLGWEPPAGGRGFVRDLADSLHTAARILLLQVLGLGLTLALTPVGLGPLAGLALSSWLAGFGWFDYPLARRGLSYGAKASWVRRNWAAAAGLGLAFQLSLLIPFFNLFLSAPAAAVAAGTLYFRLPPPAPPPGPAGARAVG